jgi:hypothetical protein
VGQSVLVLFGADYFGQSSSVLTWLAYAHMLAVAAAALGLLVGIWRFFWRLDRVGQTLVGGTLTLLAAGVFGTHVTDITFAHEIAAVLPLSAALAGRVLGAPLRRFRLEPLLAVGLAGYLGALCYSATSAPAPAQNQVAADWLVAHGLTFGLGGYWQADSITFDSGGRVTVAPLAPGTTNAYYWEAEADWFDPAKHYANFVIVKGPPVTGFGNFGRPAHVYYFAPYTVLVWNKNLIPLVGPGVS